MHATLQDFLKTLEQAGELHRVKMPVSPMLVVTEIADRHSKSPAPSASPAAKRFDPAHANLGGKALLFEKIEGCDFPLAINVFGSYRRMEMALGCADFDGFESVARRIASLTKLQPPKSIGEAIAKAREFLPLLRIGPKLRRSGPCQEVVKLTSRGEVDLTRLPLIKCWPLDGDPTAVGYPMTPEQAGTAAGQGRYITFAGMHTIHHDDRDAAKPASHNIGMYRAQLVDKTRLAMHWHMHHDGAAHWRSWKKAGEKRMPIAIALGGESVLPYGATAPLPPGISELLMAGFLNGKGIPLVKCKTVPLRVPANSEIIIEGWVSTECGPIGFDPRESTRGETESDDTINPKSKIHDPQSALGPGAVFEGPFGDHTGFYSLPDRYPIVEVTAVTHRRNAVFPATVVGLPPQEDYYMGKATERIFLPLLKTLIHDIDDYHLPMFGCFHNCAFIRIKKAYPLHARRVMHAVWGAGQMSWTKFIIVVDEDVDVHDERAVLNAMTERCRFDRDVELVHGPLDILDHAAPWLGAGCKMGFDATRKVAGEDGCGETARFIAEGAGHAAGNEKRADGALRMQTAPISGMMFIGVEKAAAGDGILAIRGAWERSEAKAAKFVIAVDASADLSKWEDVLFHWCANCDPGRDAVHHGDRMGFDATAKGPGDARCGKPVRDYPSILKMSQEIRSAVQARAAEFGLA